MHQSPDKYYINLIIKGDTSSFAILVDRYKDMVINLSFRMLQNREEAEEATQDVFVKIYKSLSRFKGDFMRRRRRIFWKPVESLHICEPRIGAPRFKQHFDP